MAAKAPQKPRRLKVFQAVFGFHESVVAAPSQAAALSAWGAHQNLFAEGAAHPATDKDAVAAALAHPLTPLRRAIGSKGSFSLKPSTPSLDIARAGTGGAKPGRSPPRSSDPEPPAPDRTALSAAEAAVERLEKTQTRREQAFRRRREALDAEEAEARTQWTRNREAALETLERERQAYRKARDAR